MLTETYSLLTERSIKNRFSRLKKKLNAKDKPSTSDNIESSIIKPNQNTKGKNPDDTSQTLENRDMNSDIDA